MIKNYFKNGGKWSGNLSKCKTQCVNVGFSHSECASDETQFDIQAFNKQELNALFKGFIKENNYTDVKVLYVDIVGVANSFSALEVCL